MFTPDFRKGSRVVMKSGFVDVAGKTGTVIEPTQPGFYLVELDEEIGDLGRRFNFAVECLERPADVILRSRHSLNQGAVLPLFSATKEQLRLTYREMLGADPEDLRTAAEKEIADNLNEQMAEDLRQQGKVLTETMRITPEVVREVTDQAFDYAKEHILGAAGCDVSFGGTWDATVDGHGLPEFLEAQPLKVMIDDEQIGTADNVRQTDAGLVMDLHLTQDALDKLMVGRSCCEALPPVLKMEIKDYDGGCACERPTCIECSRQQLSTTDFDCGGFGEAITMVGNATKYTEDENGVVKVFWCDKHAPANAVPIEDDIKPDVVVE